ncbi:MAG: PHP domain-containing protein [Candidatus Protistobacter heckmanni]|nr:PHP domain-containing protein [Candidatus Protistobacter heckmanni]
MDLPRHLPGALTGIPQDINADLHCHSRVSDGTLEPEELARRAHDAGVQLWALTDHDEIGGQSRARAAAEALGMRYVAGVEISVTWAGQTLHIVGLNVDPQAPALVEGLESVRAGRGRRAHDMSDALAKLGIHGAYEGALKYVGNPELISRTHFAHYLVEIGACSEIGEVFDKYLGEGKPAFVGHRWATLTEAVGWILAAGGVAVIAHPGRYKFTPLERHALFEEFKQLGGLAIEVTTGSHTVAQYREYAELAKEYGFLASRGSDFHGPEESRVELGSLPPLPDSLQPVWSLWR